MENKTIRIYEDRINGKWTPSPYGNPITDEATVHHMLLQDMICKYQWKGKYVKSIRRHNNYDGTCDYTVTYGGDGYVYGRAIYTIKE